MDSTGNNKNSCEAFLEGGQLDQSLLIRSLFLTLWWIEKKNTPAFPLCCCRIPYMPNTCVATRQQPLPNIFDFHGAGMQWDKEFQKRPTTLCHSCPWIRDRKWTEDRREVGLVMAAFPPRWPWLRPAMPFISSQVTAANGLMKSPSFPSSLLLIWTKLLFLWLVSAVVCLATATR